MKPRGGPERPTTNQKWRTDWISRIRSAIQSAQEGLDRTPTPPSVLRRTRPTVSTYSLPLSNDVTKTYGRSSSPAGPKTMRPDAGTLTRSFNRSDGTSQDLQEATEFPHRLKKGEQIAFLALIPTHLACSRAAIGPLQVPELTPWARPAASRGSETPFAEGRNCPFAFTIVNARGVNPPLPPDARGKAAFPVGTESGREPNRMMISRTGIGRGRIRTDESRICNPLP